MAVDLDNVLMVTLSSIAKQMGWKEQTVDIVDDLNRTRHKYLRVEVDRSGKIKSVTKLR